MPGMDGLEFAVKTKELYKELVEQSQPPIVLCSADYSSKLRSKCVRAGIERKFLFVDCEMIFYFFPACIRSSLSVDVLASSHFSHPFWIFKNFLFCSSGMLRKPLTIADLTHFVKENQATESE